MSYRTANYAAFYVTEPFLPTNLRANTAQDFRYYRLLQAWEEEDRSFTFVDAHAKTYNVRDGSEWKWLKNQLHQRLNVSKNMILFLSEYTKNSRALREEIDYGINKKGLPVIVIYPDFKEITDIISSGRIRQEVENLWNKLPVFRDNMNKVATLHVPINKMIIFKALRDRDFTVQTMKSPGVYYYPS